MITPDELVDDLYNLLFRWETEIAKYDENSAKDVEDWMDQKRRAVADLNEILEKHFEH